jgi:hypothetical protein
MDVTVQIPDDPASRMGSGSDLPRRALEDLEREREGLRHLGF